MAIIAVPEGRAAPRVKRPGDRRSLSRSATRALDVLECFGTEQRWLRAIEIARKLGLQGSTANQLLKTMVDSAHLVFDARTKTYYPSPRMVGFAGLMTRAFGPVDTLRMLMTDLQSRTQLSISLTTPNGLFMQILRMEMPPGRNTERGLQIGLFGSAVGSAYIASLPDREIEELLIRAGLDPRALPAMLEMARKVREDGYADGTGPDETFWTVAMAIPAGLYPVPMILAAAGDKDEVKARSAELKGILSAAIAHWLGTTIAVSGDGTS